MTDDKTLVITFTNVTAGAAAPTKVACICADVVDGRCRDAGGVHAAGAVAAAAADPSGTAALSCYHADDVTADGSWGDRPGPALVSATAADPDNGDAEYGDGDTITLLFDSATDLGGQAMNESIPTAVVEEMLGFYKDGAVIDLGAAVTGVWSDATTLTLTIVSSADKSPDLADVGLAAAAGFATGIVVACRRAPSRSATPPRSSCRRCATRRSAATLATAARRRSKRGGERRRHRRGAREGRHDHGDVGGGGRPRGVFGGRGARRGQVSRPLHAALRR